MKNNKQIVSETKFISFFGLQSATMAKVKMLIIMSYKFCFILISIHCKSVTKIDLPGLVLLEYRENSYCKVYCRG